ncbi:MAG: iron reductase [Rhodopseudomonas palustris]|uniref:Iron reductase n=1 Tax=Rhodopseudomonas palustris TaxID=1076 RepID=A0A933W137_RHOPL|nr:iron reductase [Rhodopseudomonas palustris]
MDGKARVIVDAVFVSLLLLVPAFILHSEPRFAGSLAGFLLGLTATVLIGLLLIYPVAKYSHSTRTLVTRVIPLRTLLGVHVYAGIVAAFLAILHSGHNFSSPLGIALIVCTMVTVVSGFIGRYYLPQTAAELRAHQSRLAVLRSTYDLTVSEMSARAVADSSHQASVAAVQGVPLLRLVEGIADLEYAIGSQKTIKTIFVQWMGVHVVAAIAMYALLTLHIAGEVYYGLRWLS